MGHGGLKKWLPYLLGSGALIVLLLVAINAPLKKRTFDERITLRQRDKIPYGTYAAHRLLQATFSKAHITFDKAAPGYWPDINADTSNQAVFLISRSFEPDSEELNTLAQFVAHGNYVFLITYRLSSDAARFFGVHEDLFYPAILEDSLQLSLQAPLAAATPYMYPGKRFDNSFSSFDTTTALTLGTNNNGQPNFIQMQSGAGKLFIHLAPLAFSNYFLLHKKNIGYFENVVSLLPPQVAKIVWNEYYLTRRAPKEQEPNILRVLWQYPAFRWGLITVAATLLLYVLSAMRRRQRLIPPYARPANDSLNFVRTIGRLYYERRDHHNLAKKMAAFFNEHVRTRYKILHPTSDGAFVAELHAKSGYEYEDLKKIADFIQYLETYTFITEQELARFYQQLTLFYQKTDGTLV